KTCQPKLAVTVAVVNIGSSAGGSPMIAHFSVPPFFGSPAGLAAAAGFAASVGLASAAGLAAACVGAAPAGALVAAGAAGAVVAAGLLSAGFAGAEVCWLQAMASGATAPAAIMTVRPLSRDRRDVWRPSPGILTPPETLPDSMTNLR